MIPSKIEEESHSWPGEAGCGPDSRAFQLRHQLFPLGGQRGQLPAKLLGQRGQALGFGGRDVDAQLLFGVRMAASMRGISSSRNVHRSSICFCLMGFRRRDVGVDERRRCWRALARLR